MPALNILQKAACEACWRALQERGVDRTEQMLTPSTPPDVARRRIADFVQTMPREHLPRLVMPEVTGYGALPGGYSARWGPASLGQRAYDLRQSELEQRASMRASEVPPWVEISDSSSGNRRSADPSDSGDADSTVKAISPPESEDSARSIFFDEAPRPGGVAAWQSTQRREGSPAAPAPQHEADNGIDGRLALRPPPRACP